MLTDTFFQKQLIDKLRKRFEHGSLFLLALRNEYTSQMSGASLYLKGSLLGTVELSDFDFFNTTMQNVGSSRKLYIADLAVREDARRLGIATSLLQTIEQIANSQNFDQLFLHVESQNYPAKNLYLRNGYDYYPISESVAHFTESHLHRSADQFCMLYKELSALEPPSGSLFPPSG